MAVQKSKPTRSIRGMRRSHDICYTNKISIDKNTKEKHIRHHITKNGFYKGIKFIDFQ